MSERQQRRRRHGWGRTALFIGLLLLLLAGAAEGIARLWLVYGKKTPAGRAGSVVLSYYPELRAPLLTEIGPGDGHFDVLVLAGSVFFDYYGGPAMHLEAALTERGYHDVRVWNLGRPAHGTRDSLTKYRWLAGKRFDWVITYEAINDLRANNVPAAEFRPNYDHLPWYAEVNRVCPAPGPACWLALDPLFGYLRFVRHALAGPRPRISADGPPPADMMPYGAEIKTRASYRRNLKEITRLARHRREPLTLATYAHYLDPAYTQAALLHDRDLVQGKIQGPKQLAYAAPAYADYAQPCEIWGLPPNVARGIDVHNAQTRRVAAEKKVDLADVAAAMPALGENFIDICHLAPSGVEVLVRTLAEHAPPQR